MDPPAGFRFFAPVTLPPVLQDGGLGSIAALCEAARPAPACPAAPLRAAFPSLLNLSISSLVFSERPRAIACSSAVTSFGAALARSMVDAISSAASMVSFSHSAMALPVDMLPALARRSNTSSVCASTGTETRGGRVGGERVLVMCSIVLHSAALVYQDADDATATLRFFRDATQLRARALL